MSSSSSAVHLKSKTMSKVDRSQSYKIEKKDSMVRNVKTKSWLSSTQLKINSVRTIADVGAETTN